MRQEITSEKTALLDTLMRTSDRIGIVTHLNPDGDALGSATALRHYLLEVLGKQSVIVLPSDLPDTLAFLSCDGIISASSNFEEAVRILRECDLIACLDLNAFNRTGCLERTLAESTAVKVLIDHHLNPSSSDFRLVFSCTDVSSASELLFHILMAMPCIGSDAHKLPPACAKSLMAGMTTDTNNFANSVWPTTLEMASALLDAGVDRDGILYELYNRYRENRVRAMGYLLSENLRITPNGVAYMIIDRNISARFDLKDGETEGFVNIPLSLDTVKMSLLLKEDDGYFRVSIRSKRGVSANTLAHESFNGGGHEQASGGRLYWPKDIDSPSQAAEYIETVTARFMQNQQPPKR